MALFLFFLYISAFSPLFVTDMSPIAKNTAVFFANYDGYSFRLSEKQSLFSFCRSENISVYYFSLLLYFTAFVVSLQDCRFSFHRHDTVIVFHSFFSVLFVGVCAFRSFFSALRSSDSCHFSLWNDIPDNRLHPSLSSNSELRFCPFWLLPSLLWSL